MTAGAPYLLLAVAAALAARAGARPCPLWCPGQGAQLEGAASPWQVLLLPPHGVVVLVPSSVRLCPPQQNSTQPPLVSTQVLQPKAETTGKPLPDGNVRAVAEEPANELLLLIKSFINTPDITCGVGQLRDSGEMCREAWPSADGGGN